MCLHCKSVQCCFYCVYTCYEKWWAYAADISNGTSGPPKNLLVHILPVSARTSWETILVYKLAWPQLLRLGGRPATWLIGNMLTGDYSVPLCPLPCSESQVAYLKVIANWYIQCVACCFCRFYSSCTWCIFKAIDVLKMLKYWIYVDAYLIIFKIAWYSEQL